MEVQDIEDYKRACEIDMEANACDLTFFKVDSTRNFYREFLAVAEGHKFRLWSRYQILSGAKALETHGIFNKKRAVVDKDRRRGVSCL
jgi:hypothetical protein